ncbi:MAG: hypothetical protein CTY12_07895 [Methylotenera sp.]|nr:MAG: hypothetical protein CTY12_07895 [Methylotenera sp.]
MTELTPQITEALDSTVEHILTTLRQIECDEVDTQGVVDMSIHYLVLQVMAVVYGSSITDNYTAIGVLDSIKQNLHYPAILGADDYKE